MLNNGHTQEQAAGWFAGKREALTDATRNATRTARGYGSSVTQRIKAHPIAAAGIAFGLGYLVMRLVRR